MQKLSELPMQNFSMRLLRFPKYLFNFLKDLLILFLSKVPLLEL